MTSDFFGWLSLDVVYNLLHLDTLGSIESDVLVEPRRQTLERTEGGHVSPVKERPFADDLVGSHEHEPPRLGQLGNTVSPHPVDDRGHPAALSVTELDLDGANGEGHVLRVAQPGHRIPIGFIHEGGLGPCNMDEQGVLGSHTTAIHVVLEEARETSLRRHLRAAKHEDRTVHDHPLRPTSDELADLHRLDLQQLGPHCLAAVEPDHLDRHDARADEHRNVATCHELQHVGEEVRAIEQQERSERDERPGN